MAESSVSGWRLAMVCAAVLTCGAACSDENAKGPEADAVDSGHTESGLGKPCASNADCKPYGLTCYITDSKSGIGICSKGCKGEGDCGNGTHCNPLSGALVCTPPRLCDACASDAECGPDAPLCVAPKFGDSFCTLKCNVGDGKCGAGFSCVQFGTKVDEFACQPIAGSCSGDGGQCSPCKTDADCKLGASCFQAKADSERFCALECAPGTANDSCPDGFGCASYADGGYCFKVVNAAGQDKLLPTCVAGSKGFCDACDENWQCASGRCATKNGKKFCVHSKDCNQHGDCPYPEKGTWCVPSASWKICAPPPAFHCHGFKTCLSHPCQGDEKCVNGFCKPL